MDMEYFIIAYAICFVSTVLIIGNKNDFSNQSFLPALIFGVFPIINILYTMLNITYIFKHFKLIFKNIKL